MEQKLIRRAIWLSYFTIGYNLVEGAVSIAFGVSEGSIALAGFGVDSLIEVASAFIVLRNTMRHRRLRLNSHCEQACVLAKSGLN